jgi:hypothetical protein
MSNAKWTSMQLPFLIVAAPALSFVCLFTSSSAFSILHSLSIGFHYYLMVLSHMNNLFFLSLLLGWLLAG